MFKRTFIILLALSLCFVLAACGGNESESSVDAGDSSTVTSENKNNESSLDNESKAESEADESKNEESETEDTIPPAFVDAVDGKLPAISHDAGKEIDLTEGITVRDNLTADGDITVTVVDLGGYDKNISGVYTVTLEAEDGNGNKATATIEVTVKDALAKVQTVTLGGNIEYVVNSEDALSYTSAGTKFRTVDMVQVMDKDTFVSQYDAFSADHTNNGKVPYFPNGVIIITDSDYNVIQVRIGAGEVCLEIESDGTVKTSGLSWTNTIDATGGGGMFKNIKSDLDKLIPDGGYIMFVGNPGEQQCRIYLIKNLFYSGYVSGPITADNCDINISGAVIELK